MIIKNIELVGPNKPFKCGNKIVDVSDEAFMSCVIQFRDDVANGDIQVEIDNQDVEERGIVIGQILGVHFKDKRLSIDVQLESDFDLDTHHITWDGWYDTSIPGRAQTPEIKKIIWTNRFKVSHDETYFKGMKEILEHGVVKTDRTGTGTLSVTGMMLKYDLRDGTIPILTSKKINTQTLKDELLWFISGSGSGKRLLEKNVKIWNEWMTPEQHLMYLYGYQWRFWPSTQIGETMLVRDMKDFQYVKSDIDFSTFNKIELYSHIRDVYSVNATSMKDLQDNYLFFMWRDMLFDVVEQGHQISDEWLIFENFAHDVIYLPGFLHQQDSMDKYCLTPFWSNSTVWDRRTCGFMKPETIEELSQPGGIWIQAIIRGVCHEHYVLESQLERFDSHTYANNIATQQATVKEGFVRRPRLHYDQLQDCIDLIKTDPYSRRIIVNTWNVDMLDRMQLPPCHFTFQFINNPIMTSDGERIETSLKLDMRSNDYCLGNPFNIAQYSMLLRMVCHLCGTLPGDLIYTGGDVHIYSNHIEQAKMQLERSGKQAPSPMLKFSDRVINTIDNFVADDLIIEHYDPMPFIKFPIAV